MRIEQIEQTNGVLLEKKEEVEDNAILAAEPDFQRVANDMFQLRDDYEEEHDAFVNRQHPTRRHIARNMTDHYR